MNKTRAEIADRLSEIADSIVIEDGQIQEIKFKGPDARDEHLKWLVNHGNVESVRLIETPGVTAAGIEALTEMKSLAGLTLAGSWVTNHICHPVGKMPQLRYLTFRDAAIDDQALEPLSTLSRLTDLDLTGCTRIDGEGLRHLTCAATLEWLFLDRTALQSDALRHLEDLQQLQHLWVNDTQVDDAALKHIKKLEKLDTLLLNRTAITDKGLADLAALSQLKRLQISGTRVKGPGLRHLLELPKLESLGLDKLPLSDEHIVPLLRIKSLEGLGLSQRYSDPQLVQFMLNVPEELMPSIKELHALGATFGRDEEGVMVLDVSVPRFTDSHVKLLKYLYVKCNHIRLADTRITDKALDDLRGMPHIRMLRKLDLTDTQVTDEAIERLKQQVPDIEVVR